jgi:anti-anti-sigma regulatory factor
MSILGVRYKRFFLFRAANLSDPICAGYRILILTQHKRFPMANNFKLLSNHVAENILLKLYGDFDGSSACELINVLKNYRKGSNRIIIDTNNLNIIHSFGADVFKRNLGILDVNKNNITITGKLRFSLEQ